MANQTKPWDDWPDTDIEAGWYVKDNGYFYGYEDGTFKPNIPINSVHFWSVLNRAGIASDNVVVSNPPTIAESQKYMPGTAWSSKPNEVVTRYRMAVMLYRFKNNIINPNIPINEDEKVISAVEQLFKDKPVKWQGVKRYSKLIGLAHVIVEDSRKYNVPLWLCLGQGWWETQWYTTGMSLNYNQGWGIKDSETRWGEIIDFHSGFANYVSVEESIHAYFKLMSSPDMPYRAWIDKLMAGDESYLRTILQAYCVNKISQHLATVKTVRGWCDERGIK